jgi:hypothetical protein
MIAGHQIDEEMILTDEVSDEALEAAAFVALGGLPTIMYRTYCFTCPVDKPSALENAVENNDLGFKVTVKVGR